MLEIRNVTKIYRSKTGTEVRALDNVSVTFPETAVPHAEDGKWMSAYREVLNGQDGEKYTGFALIYLDNDDVPELYANGFGGMLYCYDAQQDRVRSMVVAEDPTYYPRRGVINQINYDNNTSIEAFYTFKNGSLVYQGTAKMTHHEEGEPDCWWNDQKLPVSDMLDRIEEFLPERGGEVYPNIFPKEMLLAQLDHWNDPASNPYWDWKQEYLGYMNYQITDDTQYALLDVDENGIPEFFERYTTEADRERIHIGMWVYDAKTQQSFYQHLGTQAEYLPGTGYLAATYINDAYCADDSYLISDGIIENIAYGDRHLREDGILYCYSSLSGECTMEEYTQALYPLMDDKTVPIEEQFMPAERMILQLR